MPGSNILLPSNKAGEINKLTLIGPRVMVSAWQGIHVEIIRQRQQGRARRQMADKREGAQFLHWFGPLQGSRHSKNLSVTAFHAVRIGAGVISRRADR